MESTEKIRRNVVFTRGLWTRVMKAARKADQSVSNWLRDAAREKLGRG